MERSLKDLEFFHNEKGQLPSFIESLDDYPHLKIVRLRGFLNLHENPEIQHFLSRAQKKGAGLNKSILLDLKNASHVDSATIAGFLSVLSKLKKKNFKLGLMNVPDALKGALEILKLDDIFIIFESEKRALTEILEWSRDWN